MIKVITFDFYNTLVKFWPPLEDIQMAACLAKGLTVFREGIRRGYAKADILFNRANEEEPLSLRSPERRLEFFSNYEQAILETAGVPVTLGLAQELWQLAIAVPKQFTPFEDTLPALTDLHQQGYRLGVITNLRADLGPLVRQAGLEACLDFCVNSTLAGSEKPHPPIFQEALRRAAVGPDEVLHIGDQVRSDVAGARSMGMHAALLDRGGWHEPVEQCPKISSLDEIAGLLESEDRHFA
jgi:HAD superfamily hydrolase (TIGR01549 family)